MKKSILFILIFNCFGFNKIMPNNFKVSSNQELIESELVGTWKIYSSGGGIVYHVPITIIFKKEKDGELILISKTVKCFFNFKIDENKVIFSFKSKNDRKYFITKNEIFTFLISTKNENIVCELLDVKTGCTFVLNKVSNLPVYPRWYIEKKIEANKNKNLKK